MEKWEINELVQKYSDMVFKIAYQNSFNKSDSEDIVQEVFIKLIKNIGQFSNEEYMKAWLIRITVNTSKDYNKNSWYKRTKPIDEDLVGYDLTQDDCEVYKKLSKLKPVYRNIIYLYYYEGYKIREIADILDLKENTVSSNLTRAKKKLKDILDGGDDYEIQ